MRGAVSVALVYLNFDTGDGSPAPTASVIVPRRPGGGVAAASGAAAAAAAAAAGALRRHVNVTAAPASSGSDHHHHHLLRRMSRSMLAAAAEAAAAASGGGASPPPPTAALGDAEAAVAGGLTVASTSVDPLTATASVAAAMAEERWMSERQHATLIVSTLLCVVMTVLVVATLTKPLLQAALEADPRKPPLRVGRSAGGMGCVEAGYV